MTMSKLASLAHVSVSTVSKAFSMSPEVNAETREMIFDIAKKYGCFKKYYTEKYPKFVIAVICPEFRSRYYSACLSLLQKKLAIYNCDVCVAATEFSIQNKESLLNYYEKFTDVDGLIMIDFWYESKEDFTLPVVAISSSVINKSCVQIRRDISTPVRKAIEYLISKNVTDIGYIGETHTYGAYRAFEEVVLEKLGKIDPDYIKIVNKRFEEGGYLAMQSMFDSKHVPRAILCAYDNMAIGAMKCIRENGLSIPDDIAIMGANDIPEAEFFNPPLSSIDPHTDEICTAAVEAMIGKLSGKEVKSEIEIVQTLRLRKSMEIK